MKLCTFSGYTESEVKENPIREELNNLQETLDLEDSDLKFYFILDRYIYYSVNRDTGKKRKYSTLDFIN